MPRSAAFHNHFSVVEDFYSYLFQFVISLGSWKNTNKRYQTCHWLDRFGDGWVISNGLWSSLMPTSMSQTSGFSDLSLDSEKWGHRSFICARNPQVLTVTYTHRHIYRIPMQPKVPSGWIWELLLNSACKIMRFLSGFSAAAMGIIMGIGSTYL